MQRYIIKGFTGPNPDFTDEIELPDSFDFQAVSYGSATTHATRVVLKAALVDSQCPTDYLEVFDESDFECREDLADDSAQVVLCGEALGCDNCQQNHCDNEWTDGCSDAPHGGYMLTFDLVATGNCVEAA